MTQQDTRTAPSITVNDGGPYSIAGGAPVRRASIVRSEAGEAVEWFYGPDLEAGQEYSLCRCGGSSNKPFCDGTHNELEWDAAETAPTNSYDERAKTYPGTGVTVRDDRGICEHAGFCANKVSNVWKMTEQTDDPDVRATMIAMVDRCPSGALTHRSDPAGPDDEAILEPSIAVQDDGPLIVTGGVPVTRADGAPHETRNRMALCRCGASGNKPLCDGSHEKVGFRDAR